jgi:flagellar motor component MotA
LWLSQHHPQQLYAYTQDLTTRFDLSPKQRILLTQIAAKELQRTKQYKAALKSYLALTKLKYNEDQDQVLINSAFLCQAQQKKNIHLCRTIFRLCLKQCQLVVWREQSHAMLSKLMSLEAKTPIQHKKAAQFIQQYLKLYRNGTWEKDVRQYLIRHIISLEHRQGCKKARSYLMKDNKGEAWFQKYCPQ